MRPGMTFLMFLILTVAISNVRQATIKQLTVAAYLAIVIMPAAAHQLWRIGGAHHDDLPGFPMSFERHQRTRSALS